MQYSTHFNMNKPELNEQYRLSHWNENTDIIDNELYALQNLTDTTFKTNLFNFIFPKGTVYQNADDSRSPEILFGLGTWEQITDAYLACRGGTHIEASGGAWSHTLTSANIPQHTHGMQHYHVTDIQHNHGITDPGHAHDIVKGNSKITANSYQATSFWGSDPYLITGGGQVYEGVYIQGSKTGISINLLAENDKLRTSGGSVTAQGAGRTETDAYGSANPTAISLMPTYVGVYTWKRTA